MIQVILFDYGGVLCKGGGAGSVRRMLAGALAIDEAAVQDVGEPYWLTMTGNLSAEEFINELCARHPGAVRPTVDTLLAHASTIFDPEPAVYALAARLRSTGLRTGILSNIFAWTAAAVRSRGLFDDFDPQLLSCELHTMKPEAAIYKKAIAQVEVPAEHILFIDDRPEMTAGAERAGMQTIVAKTPEQIVADTTRLIQEQTGIRL